MVKPKRLTVTVQQARCPVCDSNRVYVTRTVRPIRYMRCHECHHTFKMVLSS